MPAIAVPVVAFFGATGATAAVVGAVAVGVATGAVIGGAVALIKGENIFKGMLKGALIGGVTAGIFSGVSMGLNALSGGAIGSSATEQLATMGISSTESTPDGLLTTGQAPNATNIPNGGTPTPLPNSGGAPVIPPTPPTQPTGILGKIGLGDSEAKVLAGVGQGAAEAMLKEATPTQAELTAQIQSLNKINPVVSTPGVAQFKEQTNGLGSQVAVQKVVTPPEWEKYLNMNKAVK